MKRIYEDANVTEIESSDSLSKYLMSIRHAINDETTAIALYDKIVKDSTTPAVAKEMIQEILDDEKDHLVILTELFREEVEKDFPGYGDFPEDESGVEITNEDEEDKGE